MTARIDPSSGEIIEYRACIKLSFGVDTKEIKAELFTLRSC